MSRIVEYNAFSALREQRTVPEDSYRNVTRTTREVTHIFRKARYDDLFSAVAEHRVARIEFMSGCNVA